MARKSQTMELQLRPSERRKKLRRERKLERRRLETDRLTESLVDRELLPRRKRRLTMRGKSLGMTFPQRSRQRQPMPNLSSAEKLLRRESKGKQLTRAQVRRLGRQLESLTPAQRDSLLERSASR